MGIQEDGDALLLQRFQNVADLAAAHRIDAVGRLIQNQQLGLVHQCLCQAHALQHALRILA